jgi:hypothetical protein
MGSGRLSRFYLVGAALAVLLPVSARAQDPSSRELTALAPVLDSSDGGCRSLDIEGWCGAAKALHRKLRFRVLYRAPNQFSLFICDGVDGTPLAFCSGRRAFLYDPVGPTVYYSEGAGFQFGMACAKKEVDFGLSCLLGGGPTDRIFVDFPALLSLTGPAALGDPMEQRVIKHSASHFELVANFDKTRYLKIGIDLTKKCPYTEAALVDDGITGVRLEKIALNSAVADEPFTFPEKQRLTQALPVKDVTGEKDPAAMRDLTAVIMRAFFIRSVLNTVPPSRLVSIPELQGLDLDHVRENDKKFARTLQGLVPPSLRMHAEELREAAGAKSAK